MVIRKVKLAGRRVEEPVFCVICREEAYWVVRLPCGHGFHIACWGRTDQLLCPVCRHVLGWHRLMLWAQ